MNSQIKTIDSFDKPSHPVVFFFLFLPYGIFTGYLTVTLAFLLSRAGISVAAIAGLAAINLVPQIFKFLWSPIVDITLRLKKWHMIATFTIAACLLATGLVPLKTSNLQFLTVMVLISSFARSIVSASGGSLAAHDTPPAMKGRAGGYIQAGHLGGSAVGGGVGLWLSQHTHLVWIPAATLAVGCMLCCLGLYFVKEPSSTIRAKAVSKTLNNVVKNVWLTLKTKLGLLALMLCLVPISTGAAGNLFAAISKDWNAGANTVALVTGILGGIVTIAGCLIGGWLCDLMNRQKAYLVFGLIQGASCLGMAFCPHTTMMYIIWTLIYTFISGLEYAAFSAFALEATGKGAAATKYELYSGISWAPVYMMIWIAGLAYTQWGANGMLETEAVFACVGAVLFIVIQSAIRKSKAMTASIEPEVSVT